jgi:ankyrin repeat protein
MHTQHHEALIHHAVESNQPEIVSLLVSYGAKLSVRNAHGQMPLHLAVYHGWPGMVKTLVDHGAPITAADDVRAEFPCHRVRGGES